MPRKTASGLSPEGRQSLPPQHLQVPQLLPEIQRWVLHLSKLYHRGASFFHLHLLRLLENRLDLPYL